MKTFEISERYDGKYNLWHLTDDPNFSKMELQAKDEHGQPYHPQRWIIKETFNDYKQAKEAERNLYY